MTSVHFQSALQALQSGDFQTAEQLLIQNTSDFPLDFASWNLLGVLYQLQQQWRDCDLAFRQALNLQPSNCDVLLNLGIANIALGNKTDGVQFWKDILKYEPKHTQALVNLGLFYREQERNKEAHDCWEKALSFDPGNANVQEWLADVKGVLGIGLIALGQIEEAGAMIKEALAMDPNYGMLWGFLSEWHFLRREYKEAMATCHKALELEPNNPNLHHLRGNIFRMINEDRKALESYEEALNCGGHHPATFRAISELKGEDLEQDSDVIEVLFDQYAESFDRELQEKLHYQTPFEAYKIYQRLAQQNSITDILDLGCGTGLSIQPFIKENQYRVGVDISSNMLEKAKSKNYYDELHHASLTDFLQSNERQYDLLLCLDALVYFRDLELLLSLFLRSTKAGQICIFSTENRLGKRPRLQRSGRYAHSVTYIQDLCQQLGWNILKQEDSRLRKDAGRWILGTIWVVQKPIFE